ncbi:MAG: hypothetical protein ACE15C_04985 [Phycisphaerae bacterium]
MNRIRSILAAFSLFAAIAGLATFAPGQARSWGWRGDGTGLFSDATPPVKWGRTSATLQGLTSQADKPKGDEAGANSARLGNIPEWLVLGPIAYEADAERKALLAKEFVEGEAKLQPAAGDKAAGVEWRKVRSTGAQLNLNLHYNDMPAKVFYAHAYLHSKDGGRIMLRLMGPTCRFWFNGKDVLSMEETSLHFVDKEVELQKGWNSLLIKVFASRRDDRTDTWANLNNMPQHSAFFQVVMWGRGDSEKYESKGILWEAPLPQAPRFSVAQPLVIGDRVFVNTDPSFVICYDKMTGKRLWIDYCGHYEFVTQEERAANAELFKQIDPAVKRIKELAASWGGTLKEDLELHADVLTVVRLLKQVDGKKYMDVIPRQEAGWAGLTSCTDGKYVYTWITDGVVVCHDLEGKRKWMVLDNQERRKEVQVSHGYHVSPILTDKEFVVPTDATTAYDKETGKVLWKLPTKVWGWPPVTPITQAPPMTAEGVDCINYDYVGLYKPGVGFFPWSWCTVSGNKAYLGDFYQGTAVTEVIIPETITPGTKLPGKSIPLNKAKDLPLLTLGSWSAQGVVANVLVHDGLIYTVAMGGPLRVFDQKTLEPVYSVRLDMNTIMFAYPYPHGSGVCASPALGGKNIYIFGSGGHSMIIKPGRKFEVVAENRIERLMPGRYEGGMAVPADKGFYPECTASSPIFDGDRIYYQAEGHLYCISAKP